MGAKQTTRSGRNPYVLHLGTNLKVSCQMGTRLARAHLAEHGANLGGQQKDLHRFEGWSLTAERRIHRQMLSAAAPR